MNLVFLTFTTSLILLLVFYYYYYQRTLRKKDIIIIKKYEIFKDNVTSYYVIDENNNQYKFDSCLWKLHYSHIDLWNKINEKEEYRITYFGKNYPTLNIFPIIIGADKICKDYDENYYVHKT
jgi:hypothetical protein